MVYQNITVLQLYFLFQGCRQFRSSQGLGLHSYDCLVESSFSKSVQTLPGRKYLLVILFKS